MREGWELDGGVCPRCEEHRRVGNGVSGGGEDSSNGVGLGETEGSGTDLIGKVWGNGLWGSFRQRRAQVVRLCAISTSAVSPL